jgi:uncharacterized membrane protein
MLEGCGIFYLILLAIPVAIAVSARQRVTWLEGQLETLRTTAIAQMAELKRELRQLREDFAHAQTSPQSDVNEAETETTAPPATVTEAGSVSIVDEPPPPADAPVPKLETPPGVAPFPAMDVPAMETAATPLPTSGDEEIEESVAAFEAVPPVGSIASQPPPSAEPPPPPPPPPTVPPRASPSFDFESLVGVKLFSWIAGIALALAGIFFLRYSIDHGWVTPPIRMAIGFITGTALLAFSSLRLGNNYRVTTNALDGAAISILYGTTYAAHALWQLIPFSGAFVMMVIVTIVAVLLSIRRDSLFIALLGMLGGFATPAILSSQENRPIALFSYLLILNAGLAWTAYRRRWPFIVGASVVFTTLYQLLWVGRFLDSAQLPLAAAIFLAFPLLFAVTHIARRSSEEGPSPLLQKAIAFSGIVPLAFALYTAAVPAIGSRFHVLFAFLILAVAGFSFVAVRIARDVVAGGLPALATLVVFAVWLARAWTPAAWPSILAWLALFVVTFAFGPRLLRRLGENELIDRSTIVSGVLLFAWPALIVLEPATRSPLLIFAAGAALLCVVAASAFRSGRQSDYLMAALAMLVAQGFWSGVHLAPDNLPAAMLLYGGFGLLLLAIPAAGRRLLGRDPLPASPWLLFGTLAVAAFLLLPSVQATSFAVLALITVFLFAAFTWEAIRAGRPWMFVLGGAGTLLLLFLWMSLTGVPRSPASLFAIITLLSVAALVSAALALRKHESLRLKTDFAAGAYLALSAEAFLLFAVVDNRIQATPVLILSVLGIVVVAKAIGALHLRQPFLHILSICGALTVLTAWIVARSAHDSMASPLFAACAVTAFSIAWIAAARRVFRREHPEGRLGTSPLGIWTATAVIALIALQLITILAGTSPHAVASLVTLAILVAVPITLAVLAGAAGWHAVVLIAVASSAVSAVAFRHIESPAGTTPFAFIVAVAHYLTFTAYGFLALRRSGRDVTASLVAIAATVPFFFLARDAMHDWNLGGVIGILPVILSIVLLALLRQTIRAEKEMGGEVNNSRRALVAAAALAFITVAIPLQLEKEWITVGWALEAAALAWLFTRIPHRGLFAAATGLFAVVFVRLVFNPAVFSYHPQAERAILNWYLYTYVVAAAAFFAGAFLLRRTLASDEPRPGRSVPAALSGAGTLLLFLLLNIEIADFYSNGSTLTFNFFSASLAQELTYTLGWAVFAIALLVAGIAGQNRGARIAAITLLSLTIFKCFIHDLGRLGGLYRVASFVGLAISLSLVAVLLQRFAIRRTSGEAPS